MDFTEIAQDIKQKFEEKTWLDLFQASHTYYNYLLFTIDSDEELIKFLKEDSWSTYDVIMDLADYIVKASSLQNTRDKVIKSAVNYSIDRSLIWERARTDKYTIASEEMFNESKIKESFLEHTMACFNPLMFYSDYNWWVRCIFRPTPSLCKRYDFIRREYYPGTFRTKEVLINLEWLRAYDNIQIMEHEIWPIYYKLYHPILWSRIANKEFEKFMLIS